MIAADLLALLPLTMLAIAAVVVMMVVAFCRRHELALLWTLAGLTMTFATLPVAALVVPRQVTPLLILDHYALFYIGLITVASGMVALLAYGYLQRRAGRHEEFYILLLLATLGAAVLVASSHFAAFFLGLELLSVALFALIAYPADRRYPLEAGVKYLILSGVASAFLLFGIALIYAELGTLQFTHLGPLLAAEGYRGKVYMLTGLAMLITGLGFKLSLVPFHLWTPDVYEGAPAPITAFVATVSKGALFALLLRYFVEADAYRHGSLFLIFSLMAIASMLIGNLLALLQDNVKRILAYSSIAHLGYLLVAFLAGGSLAVEAVSYYLVAYFITTLGAFGVVSLLSHPDRQTDTDTLEDYRGLFWQRPWLAATFTAMLFSLAGIPLTAGFVGKFYIFAAGVEGTLWLLVAILIIGSTIGLFYYLRIIVIMTMPLPEDRLLEKVPSASLASSVAVAVLALLLVWLGVYPAPLIDIIQTTASGL